MPFRTRHHFSHQYSTISNSSHLYLLHTPRCYHQLQIIPFILLLTHLIDKSNHLLTNSVNLQIPMHSSFI
ncbi:unnamed protein product [Heterobilharzia americana]|nr:unnamed protein product [Heterobilharzia americana]